MLKVVLGFSLSRLNLRVVLQERRWEARINTLQVSAFRSLLNNVTQKGPLFSELYPRRLLSRSQQVTASHSSAACIAARNIWWSLTAHSANLVDQRLVALLPMFRLLSLGALLGRVGGRMGVSTLKSYW